MAIEFGKIEAPYWDDGKPVAVVAGGRSLDGFDFETLRGRAHVLVVKGSIFDLPWADAGFGLDTPRLQEWQNSLRSVKMQVYWAVPDALPYEIAPIPCITYLRRSGVAGLSKDPKTINGGGTSGFGSLNVAWHKLRQKRGSVLVLLGFDYIMAKTGKPFRHNDKHYIKGRKQNPAYWSGWADNFAGIAPDFTKAGITVLNASPESTVNAFPKITLDEAKKHLAGV